MYKVSTATTFFHRRKCYNGGAVKVSLLTFRYDGKENAFCIVLGRCFY